MQIVLDYLKRNQARFVAELCEFLRFPSVSAQPQHKQDLRACAGWLANHCRQIGLEARVCPTAGHPIVVAKTPLAATKRSEGGMKHGWKAKPPLRLPAAADELTERRWK
jgi:acetylornithine deacetylase/succinyl-diaminopimelate desuccinylase-like protein